MISNEERRLQKMAKQVAIVFIKEPQRSLDDLIYELVERERLNNHEVSRVCEMANHSVRGHFFSDPSMDQAMAMFPPANPMSILQMLSRPASDIMDEQLGAFVGDYMEPPTKRIVIIKKASAYDFPQRSVSKPLGHALEKAAEARAMRIDNMIKEAEDNVSLSLMRYRTSKDDFIKEANSHVLRGGDPLDIIRAGMSVDKDLFVEHVDELVDEMSDMTKQALSSLDDAIAKDLNVTFIKGDAPLVIRYRKLKDATKRAKGTIDEYEKIIQEKQAADPSAEASAAVDEFANVANMPAKSHAEGIRHKSLLGGLGSSVNLGFLGLGMYSKYKQDTAKFNQYDAPGANILGMIANKHPTEFKRMIDQTNGAGWLKNTPMQRAVNAKRRSSWGDDKRFRGMNDMNKMQVSIGNMHADRRSMHELKESLGDRL